MTISSKNLISKLPILITCTALIFVLDQWSKTWVLERIAHGELIPIIPNFFNLTLTFNYGAAFGLWTWLPENLRIIALFVSTAIALMAIAYFLLHEHFSEKLGQIALSMILGGALGNIVDRFQHGAVVDFLDLYYGNYHWPAFNLADSAICIGVFVLILFGSKKKEATPAPMPQS